ncbi:MAG: hypothetical protein KBT22_05010 [Bacteroidales bacterium]|nr:hypothetical protein [Candidatus Scybalocola fimicaballi]
MTANYKFDEIHITIVKDSNSTNNDITISEYIKVLTIVDSLYKKDFKIQNANIRGNEIYIKNVRKCCIETVIVANKLFSLSLDFFYYLASYAQNGNNVPDEIREYIIRNEDSLRNLYNLLKGSSLMLKIATGDLTLETVPDMMSYFKKLLESYGPSRKKLRK